MKQDGVGFLEHLYHSTFRPDLARYPTPDEEKVQRFIERYWEAVGDQSARELEALGYVPDEVLDKLKSVGLFGLTVSEQYGGLGFTISEYLRAVEQMAGQDMALVLVPLAHLSIGIKGIVLFGTEEQKSHYLTRAASGEMIFSYALTEPKAGSDAQHIETSAVLDDDGEHYLLNGTKTYITNGNYSQGFTVFAQLDENNPGHMGAFIVERDWEGVSVGKDMPKMGLAVSSTTPIQFKNVRVPKENMLGEPGDGFKIAMTILNYGRLGLGAASAGLMWRSLDDMNKRASARTQFGSPIREFELIQEKIVRAKAHAYAASNMTYLTASMLEAQPHANVAIESSHCKLYGTDRCWDTLYDALQTAGGSGYLSTQPYEKRMRDFRVTTIFEGTSEIHSIYPPLTLLRNLGKEVGALKGGFAKARYLWRFGRTVALKKMRAKHPTLSEALDVARRNERLFRKLAKRAMLRYRSKVVSHEFLLRRMTNLSLSLYCLVSTVVSLEHRFPGGDYPTDELRTLEYLTAEAREVQARYGRFDPTELERAHAKVMEQIKPSHAGSDGAESVAAEKEAAGRDGH